MTDLLKKTSASPLVSSHDTILPSYRGLTAVSRESISAKGNEPHQKKIYERASVLWPWDPRSSRGVTVERAREVVGMTEEPHHD